MSVWNKTKLYLGLAADDEYDASVERFRRLDLD